MTGLGKCTSERSKTYLGRINDSILFPRGKQLRSLTLTVCVHADHSTEPLSNASTSSSLQRNLGIFPSLPTSPAHKGISVALVEEKYIKVAGKFYVG